MFSKVVLKLLDIAILPSLLVFSFRFASLVLGSLFFSIPLTVSVSGIAFQNYSQFYQMNTFSNIFLLLSLSAILLMSSVRLVLLNRFYLSPVSSSQLEGAGLYWLTISRRAGYLNAFIWIALYLFMTLSLLIQGILKYAPLYLFAFSCSFLALNVFITILAVERDFKDDSKPAGVVMKIEEELCA